MLVIKTKSWFSKEINRGRLESKDRLAEETAVALLIRIPGIFRGERPSFGSRRTFSRDAQDNA